MSLLFRSVVPSRAQCYGRKKGFGGRGDRGKIVPFPKLKLIEIMVGNYDTFYFCCQTARFCEPEPIIANNSNGNKANAIAMSEAIESMVLNHRLLDYYYYERLLDLFLC